MSLFFSDWFLSDLLGSKTFFSNFQDLLLECGAILQKIKNSLLKNEA